MLKQALGQEDGPGSPAIRWRLQPASSRMSRHRRVIFTQPIHRRRSGEETSGFPSLKIARRNLELQFGFASHDGLSHFGVWLQDENCGNAKGFPARIIATAAGLSLPNVTMKVL